MSEIFIFMDDRHALFAVKRHDNGHYWLYIHHPGSDTFSSYRQINQQDVEKYRKRRIPPDQEQKLLEKLQ